MKQIKKYFVACIVAFAAFILFWSQSASEASAHGSGPPYVILNGQYITTNPITNLATPTQFTVGADSTPSAYLVNQPLTFEIDEQFFPNPYRTSPIFLDPKPEEILKVVYRWDFKDGTTKEDGQKVTHTYTKPGTYIIDLSVAYPEKNPDFASVNTIQIDIVPNQEYVRPAAKIKVNGRLIENPDRDTAEIKPAIPVELDGSESTGKIVKYLWDFGDDKGSEEKATKHRFSRDSFFPVTVLRVTDENNLINDTQVLLDLPYTGGNPILNIWHTIQDFFVAIFYR